MSSPKEKQHWIFVGTERRNSGVTMYAFRNWANFPELDEGFWRYYFIERDLYWGKR